ncbi:MAG: DUF4388 domain-containing protein [Calditrichaeota bacterium]|nr:DUF4388 domain-containing protein [Calditrichota bacterium]
MGDKSVKIIVVDDNVDLTNAIVDYYNSHDQGIIPLSVTNPSDVSAILAENPDVKLILTDYYMPEMNGMELVKSVQSSYPDIRFILMTGYHSENKQKISLEEGVINYFRKPFSIGKLTHVINEIMDKENAGFDGVIESVQLPDIIQLINTSQSSVALKLSTTDKESSIFFVKGEIIHAESGDLTGEEAFYDIFNWVGGSFHTVPLVVDVKQTITSSTPTLIIEAARRQDEAAAWSGNIPSDLIADEDPPWVIPDEQTNNGLIVEDKDKIIMVSVNDVSDNSSRNSDENVDAGDNEINFNDVEPTDPESPEPELTEKESDVSSSDDIDLAGVEPIETTNSELNETSDDMTTFEMPDAISTTSSQSEDEILDLETKQDEPVAAVVDEPDLDDAETPETEPEIEEKELDGDAVDDREEVPDDDLVSSNDEQVTDTTDSDAPESLIEHSTLHDDQGFERSEDDSDVETEEAKPDEEMRSFVDQFDVRSNFEPGIDASKFETDYEQEKDTEKVVLDDKMIGEAIEKAVDYYIKFWPSIENEIKAPELPLDTLPKSIRAHFQFRLQQDLTKVVNTGKLSFDFKSDDVTNAVENLLSTLFASWEFTRNNYLDILRYAVSFELAHSIDPARAATDVLHELSGGIASKMKPLIRAMINFEMIGDQYLALIVDIAKQGDREINTHTLEYLCRSVIYRLDEEHRWLMFRDAMERMLEISRVGLDQTVDYLHFNVVLNMLEAHGLAQVSDFINMTREMGKMDISIEEAEEFFDKYKARSQSVTF